MIVNKTFQRKSAHIVSLSYIYMIFHRCYFVELLQIGLALADGYCPAVIQICRTGFSVIQIRPYVGQL